MNEWIQFLKSEYQKNGLTLKETMKVASKQYQKKPKAQAKTQRKKVKFADGEGIYQDVVNTINKAIGSKAVDLQDGEYHLWDSNYTGPGTKLAEKLKKKVPSLNKVDLASKIHDIEYNDAKKISDPQEKAKKIRESDEKALAAYKSAFVSEPLLASAAYTGIKTKNIFENSFPKLAKRIEKDYYGSVDGKGVGSHGIAKNLFQNEIYSK